MRDNGCGFETAHERVTALYMKRGRDGGELDITSQPGEGACVTLSMPINGRPKIESTNLKGVIVGALFL